MLWVVDLTRCNRKARKSKYNHSFAKEGLVAVLPVAYIYIS